MHTTKITALILVVFVIMGSNCSSDETGSSDGKIHYNFFTDGTSFFNSSNINGGIIELCSPYDYKNCSNNSLSFVAGDETKLIRIGQSGTITEQEVLKLNGIEKRTGINVDKGYLKDKFSDLKPNEEFLKEQDPAQLSTIEKAINDYISTDDIVFVYASSASQSEISILGKTLPVFHSIPELKDSIGSRLCKTNKNEVSIIFELSLFTNSDYKCTEEEKKEQDVCGDGSLYSSICRAKKAGAQNIHVGRCKDDIPLPPLDKEKLQTEAEGFINNFYEYLGELKEGGSDLKKDVMSIFIDDGQDVQVEISNKGNSLNDSMTLSAYLDDFINKGHLRVVTVKNIVFDESFGSIPDGDINLPVITAHVEQNYKRYDRKLGKGKVVYEDTTGKGIEIIARLVESPGSGKLEWRAFLSNITVEKKAH